MTQAWSSCQQNRILQSTLHMVHFFDKKWFSDHPEFHMSTPPPPFRIWNFPRKKKKIQIHPHQVPPLAIVTTPSPFGLGVFLPNKLAAGMFLFLITQSHITADVLGKRVFGHHLDKMGTEDPVAESFETATRQERKRENGGFVDVVEGLGGVLFGGVWHQLELLYGRWIKSLILFLAHVHDKFSSHRIHVWYVYLHLVDFYGTCREISLIHESYGVLLVASKTCQPHVFVGNLDPGEKKVDVKLQWWPKWCGTWRIIPFSKWLITMVSKSPNWGYSPSKSPKWFVNGGC